MGPTTRAPRELAPLTITMWVPHTLHRTFYYIMLIWSTKCPKVRSASRDLPEEWNSDYISLFAFIRCCNVLFQHLIPAHWNCICRFFLSVSLYTSQVPTREKPGNIHSIDVFKYITYLSQHLNNDHLFSKLVSVWRLETVTAGLSVHSSYLYFLCNKMSLSAAMCTLISFCIRFSN